MLLWHYTLPLQDIISTQQFFEDSHYIVLMFCKLSTFGTNPRSLRDNALHSFSITMMKYTLFYIKSMVPI